MSQQPNRDVVHAARIDPLSFEWESFVSQFELEDYGVPNAVLIFHSDLYVASDPLVYVLSGCSTPEVVDHLLGVQDWIRLPVEASGSLTSASQWVKDNIAGRTEVASDFRLPRRTDVDDDPPPGAAQASDSGPSLALASPRYTRAVATLAESGIDLGPKWIDYCADALVAAARAEYTIRGGVVDDSLQSGSTLEPLALRTQGVAVFAETRPARHRPDSKGWARALSSFGHDDYQALVLESDIATGVGTYSRHRWGSMAVGVSKPDPEHRGGRPSLSLNMSEGFVSLVGGRAIIDAFRFALEAFPVEQLVVTYGRRVLPGPWLVVIPRASLTDGALTVSELAEAFEIVAEVEAGGQRFVWLQVTEDQGAMTARHAKRAAAVLRDVGVPVQLDHR